MKWARATALLASLALSSLALHAGADDSNRHGSGPRRKNVILITLDALRQDHLSLFGYSRETSPAIDWLAQNGIAFPSIIPSGCSTKASLTSLYTSMGFSYHHMYRHNHVLPDDYLTLAEIFKGNGYKTSAFVGTGHMGAKVNADQGFDSYEDYSSSSAKYIDADMVGADLLAELRELSEKRDSPFFIYAHFEEPHPPWRSTSPWLTEDEPLDRFFDEVCLYLPSAEELANLDGQVKRNLVAKYDGAIKHVDSRIALILDELRSNGSLGNTIIAISTDHGIELVDRYSATHGYNPFDEVVRGFLVLFDGGRPFEQVDPVAIQGRIMDIGPTLLGQAAIDIPDGLQGVDLIRDPDALPTFAFTQCYNAVSVRSLDFKLISVGRQDQFLFQLTKSPGKALRRVYSSLTLRARRFFQDDPGRRNKAHGLKNGIMLFDLRADPGELIDCKERHPDQLERMRRELERYWRELETESIPVKTVTEEQLSSETIERLKALGYIE
jgi:arylsulfatase A-like enzyme